MINDFYTKLSEQEKKIFYVAVSIVFLMVLDRAFLGPVLSRMKSLDAEIAQQKSVIQRDLRFLSYKDRILKENETLKSYYENETKTVEEIIAVFLKNLEMMATQSKVNLIKVAPTDSKQKKGYIEYYASLECEGFLENLVTFMHAIDTSDDLLKIIKVDMGLKRASGEEILCNMVVAKIIIDSDKEFDAAEEKLRRESQGGSGAKGNGRQSSKSRSSSDSSAGSGSSASSSVRTDFDDAQMDVLNSPSSSSGEDEEVSQRFLMKGFTPKKGEKVSAKDAAVSEPIKKSAYEKIMNRAKKEFKK